MQHTTLTAAFYALAPAAPAHHQHSFHAFGITHHVTPMQGTVIAGIVLLLLVAGVIAAVARRAG
jgi:hypothetical protein